VKKRLLAVFSIITLAVSASFVPISESRNDQQKNAHAYLKMLLDAHRELDTNAIFLSATRCKGCHGFDPMGIANVNAAGEDINLFDDWETSMMGLAGVDPLWKAKVRHEVLVNPAHATELQDLCTSCHAPMGHFEALYKQQAHYGLADLENDSLGKSGVGCLGCHAIGTEGLGNRFTGDIPYDTNRYAYGPFPGPMLGPMQLYVNYTPAYSPHVSEGRFCSPCHTLITHPVDEEGNSLGTSFVEQATYQEWINSSYPEEGTQCQTCHMPKIEDPVKIAVGYTGLPGRAPFNLHTFSGANSFMVNLIKQNKNALGVTANNANFDSTLSEITRLLRFNTVDVTVSNPIIEGDSVVFPVELLNKAGHKFPSGYPSRRAFVSFVVQNASGDTLFSSGVPLSSGHIKNIAEGSLEPHHQTIRNASQAQIYEMRMGDVNGNLTTVLERGYSHLKDNRLPPLGFTSQHINYDSVQIAGAAANDPDFNKNGNFEGTGKDIVFYKLALNELNTEIKVSAKVYYQAVPPYWLDEMRGFSAPEIDQFLGMYDAADKMAVYLSGDSIEQVMLPLSYTGTASSEPQFFPNPAGSSADVYVNFNGPIHELSVYSLSGQKINVRLVSAGKGRWRIEGLNRSGVFLVQIRSGNKKFTRRIVKSLD
jgi:hypothetical protein